MTELCSKKGSRRGDPLISARQILRYAWVFPISGIGLLLVPLIIVSGGTVRRLSGNLEASGGFLSPLLTGLRIEAVTIGHIIFGPSEESLGNCRVHEHAHVRQCERWGMFFPFLYAVSSMIAFLRGRDPYHDNAFEKEAFISAAMTD